MPQVDVLAELVATRDPAAVLVPVSVDGKEIAGRLAVRLGPGLLSGVVNVSPEGVASDSLFGGAHVAEAEVTAGVPVLAVLARPSRRSCTSRWASLGQSNTEPGCRP